MPIVNVIGKKYGRLLILDEYAKKNKSGRSLRYVIAQCECGKQADVSKNKILRGITKSCGCLQRKNRSSFGSRIKKPYGVSAFNECYAAYRKSAERRNYNFDLSKEEFKSIITKPCIYCGESLTQEKKPSDKNSGSFKYTGIDRYDNSIGYVFSNCVPCCCACNRLKSTMNAEEFETRITRILERKNIWKRI